MRRGLLALLVSSLLAGCAERTHFSALPDSTPPAPAVTAQDIQREFQPDRPDISNGTHIVPVGLLQLETGGEWTNNAPGNDDAGLPFSLRLGLADWLEARVEGFDDIYQSATGQNHGLSGLSTGAKISFSPAFAIIPAVQLPVGTQHGTHYLLTLITGTDFARANHADVNYGMAANSADPGHFFQQWFAVSVNRQVSDRFSPYIEIYWLSREEPAGPHVVSTDFGVACTLNERLAFDVGGDVGLTDGAPRARLFAGLSVIVGETFGHKGVHGRLKEAAERHAASSR